MATTPDHGAGGQELQDTAEHETPRPVAYIESSECDRAPNCPVRQICPQDAIIPLEGQDTEEEPRKSLFGLLKGQPSHGWQVDSDRCSGCLLCAQYCPHDAVVAKARGAV